MIVSVSTLTGVLLKLPSGALSDIYGRRMLLRVRVIAFGLPPDFSISSFGFESAHIVTALPRLGDGDPHQRARHRRRPVSRTAWGSAGHLYGLYTIGSLAGPVHRRIPRLCVRLSSAFLTAGLVGCIAYVLFYSLRLTRLRRVIRTRGWRR